MSEYLDNYKKCKYLISYVRVYVYLDNHKNVSILLAMSEYLDNYKNVSILLAMSEYLDNHKKCKYLISYVRVSGQNRN